MNRFSMALIYGRAGCLTAKNGGFRPEQMLGGGATVAGFSCDLEAEQAAADSDHRATARAQVRQTPSWPRSWANFRLL